MGSKDISSILAEINEKGNFISSLITDREGFPIAAVSHANTNQEVLAAVIGLFQRATTQASEQLGVSISSEFTLHFDNGNLLICHPFTSKGVDMILALLLLSKKQAYRRLMNQTISAVQKTFEL
jgi:predicted regulator of Ras-like GTPase activity (Roadblock/LC7/MglB family)